MKRVRQGGLITLIGFITFVLGTGDYFHNLTLQGFFLLVGLFIMIPLGTIITLYFQFFKRGQSEPEKKEAETAGQELVIRMFVPLILSFIPIVIILPALGISGTTAGAVVFGYILAYFIIQFLLLRRRKRR